MRCRYATAMGWLERLDANADAEATSADLQEHPMPENTINLSRQAVSSLPIGVLQPKRNMTRFRLFTIAETDPEPTIITPPGWRIHQRVRQDGNLIYAIIPDPEHEPHLMQGDQYLIRKYREFFDYDQTGPWVGMPAISAKSAAKFCAWIASPMADVISGRPSLTDFEKDALPALRSAWRDATDALFNARKMIPPKHRMPEVDFLFEIAQPHTAEVATVWLLTERARQYVSQQNQTFPDRFITGHHASLRRTLEYEGFRTAEVS